MNPRFAFFLLFLVGAAGTIYTAGYTAGGGAPWTLLIIVPAAIFGLAAATFCGWIRWYLFEKYVTVPLVIVARFFNRELEHDQYLAEWEMRK